MSLSVSSDDDGHAWGCAWATAGLAGECSVLVLVLSVVTVKDAVSRSSSSVSKSRVLVVSRR